MRTHRTVEGPHSKPCQLLGEKNGRSGKNETENETGCRQRDGGGGPIRPPAEIRCSCKQKGEGAPHCCQKSRTFGISMESFGLLPLIEMMEGGKQ